MILKSFGDSFIFGNDLHDDGRDTAWGTPSQHTWPALLAKSLGMQYACYAKGGSGNLLILDRVLLHATSNDRDCLYVISWSYSSRHDFVPAEKYHAPRRAEQYLDIWHTLQPIHEDALTTGFYRNYHSPYTDKLLSLLHINSAIDHLDRLNIPFLMTGMDDSIFSRDHDAPLNIRALQDRAKSRMHFFEGKNFLQWSRDHGFEISANNHPLESAHQAAHDIMLPISETLT